MDDCEICHGSRWKSVTVDGVERLTRCDCWRRDLVAQTLKDAKIPSQYARAELSNFEGRGSNQKMEAYRAAMKFATSFPVVDKGILFHGPHGVGKTHLAVGILKQAIRERGARGYFFETRELLRLVRDTYNRTVDERELDVLSPVLTADILVLDDLGAEKSSEWVQETLGLVINTRYNEKRPTIVTTNLDDEVRNDDPRSFIWQIGARTRSRLKEMCDWVKVAGADVREVGVDQSPDKLAKWESSSPASPKNLPDTPKPKGMARARLRDSGKQYELNWSGGKAGSK
jgi:DNA replication protein DnaC